MKIAVFGAKGRVGQRVCEIAKKRGHAVFEVEKQKKLSADKQVDVVIDFSTPEATAEICEFCKLHRCHLVSGVTGRDEAEKQLLDELKTHVKVVESANFSKGVKYLTQICKLLAALNWDCDVVETHRKQKKDSPSGTAKQLACVVAQNGTPEVVVHSIRSGSNFGKHEVVFATEGESITVTHQAENTDIFALGAIETAEFVCK